MKHLGRDRRGSTSNGEVKVPVSPKYRVLSGFWRIPTIVAPAVAITFCLMFFRGIHPFGYMLFDIRYLFFLLALFTPCVFLWIPATKGASRDRVPWYDILLSLAAFGGFLFLALSAFDIVLEGWAGLCPANIVAPLVLLWLLVIEASRRSVNSFFAGIVLLISVYPLFGEYLPGFFNTRHFSLGGTAGYHMMSGTSLLGVPLQIFGTLVIGFLVFAVVMQVAGVGSFFNDVASSLLGNTRARNAKVAVVASALFGSISGSAVPNIMTTGSFTIPAMKKEGLSPEFASAVEAAASTGGVILPPIMGIIAFIMAEFLGISYVTVCMHAAVPAFFYFLCLFVQLDAHAGRTGMKPTRAASEFSLWQILTRNSHLLAGLVVLLVYVFYMRMIAWAPWYASATLVVLCMVRKKTRLGLSHAEFGLQRAGRTLGELVVILGCVGLIIGGLSMTGKAMAFPFEIVMLLGDRLWLLLPLGAVVTMILGMGVPPAASYIFLAVVLAPALVQCGVDLIAAHLFIMYCALFAYLTPPVCTAAYAAAAIGEANPIKTGFLAMRLGAAKFVLPFCFALGPALILRGESPGEMVQAVCTCAIGIMAMGTGIEGYIWKLGKTGFVTRIVGFAGGVLLAFPGTYTDLLGISALGVMLGACWLKGPKSEAKIEAFEN